MQRPDPDEPRFIHRKFDHPGLPRVSVVIPSLDGHRGGNVELLLEAFQEQTHPPHEVIVVIGLRPAGRARNRGVERSTGDLVLLIDDDIELRDEELIARLVTALEESGGSAGWVSPLQGVMTFSNDFQSRAAVQIPRFAPAVEGGPGDPAGIPNSCYLMERDRFLDCGGESEIRRGEPDRELRAQLTKEQLHILGVREALVGHPAPENWDVLLSLAYRDGEICAETTRYDTRKFLETSADPLASMREVESTFSRIRDWGIDFFHSIRKGWWIRIADDFAWLSGWLSGFLLDFNRNRILFDRAAKSAVAAIGQIRRLQHPPKPALRILTYHRIADIPGYPLCVPRREFQRQIDYLLDQGMLIDFQTALESIRSRRPITRNQVAITFDDGFRDLYTHARPILEERGVTAGVFLVAGRIGGLGEFGWLKKHGAPNYHILNWEQVRQLRDTGMVIGSHSQRHERLALLPNGEARQTILESLDTVEREIGERPICFAYPYGRQADSGEREREILREAGVEFAFGAHYGSIRPGADRLNLPRIDIDASDTFEVFKSKVHGDFDSAWPWSDGNKPREMEEAR